MESRVPEKPPALADLQAVGRIFGKAGKGGRRGLVGGKRLKRPWEEPARPKTWSQPFRARLRTSPGRGTVGLQKPGP